MSDDPIVIVGMARTPMGGFQGDLQNATASELGAEAIRAAVARAGLKGEDIDEVIMGNILSAGQGQAQAPARQASIGAGIPDSVGCTTINKMCGSGMKAAMLSHDLITAGANAVMVAGGMESMTKAPYLLDRRARATAWGWRGEGPYVPRRPRRRLRQGHADGRIRRGDGAEIPVHARAAGRIRHYFADPRPHRHRGRLVRRRGSASHHQDAQGGNGSRA